MICTKCGQENPDDAKSCHACGYKLQSGRKAWEEENGGPAGGIPELTGPGPSVRKKTRKHLEAWVVAVLVWAAVYGLIQAQWYWPLYPLVVLAGAYAWARGITWKD